MKIKKKKDHTQESRKKPYKSHFGRCTPEEREECTACTAEGKKACAAAAAEYDETRGPRKGPKDIDPRKFTPIPNEAVRWSLGPRHDYLQSSYTFLISWTTPHTNLVYQPIKALAAQRDVSEGTFYRHLLELEKLGLIKFYQRKDVFDGNPHHAERAVYVLPLPSWVSEIDGLLEEIATLSKTKLKRAKIAKRDKAIAALEELKKEVLSKLIDEKNE